MVSSLTQPAGVRVGDSLPLGTASALAEASLKENRQLEPQDTQKIGSIRHTCAHIMAMAVQKLYPGTKVAIGPVTETGFFYDFDSPVTFTRDHFPKIIKEMRRIIKANLPIVREVVSKDDIKAEIVNLGEPYKLEILDTIPDGEIITRYFIDSPDTGKLPKSDVPIEPSLLSPIVIPPQATWWDLCAGPHVNSTGEIDPNSFGLESLAGAYWRGDETKPMLQRIYGTAWETPEQLAAYLTQKIEELVCLSACKRPCAIALTGMGKMSLMFGDLPPLNSADVILKLCEQYHVITDGIIPRQERPEILQQGILTRIPPSSI